MHLPAPLAIDPRPCEWCKLTIDRHRMVDHGEGPEFFCPDLSPDEMTLAELERRAELIRQEEVAAIIARWEAAAAVGAGLTTTTVARAPEPYRPAASTVDTFLFLVGTDDAPRVRAWLADRPKDMPYLLDLLESKTAC
jgi:hypothetical protein